MWAWLLTGEFLENIFIFKWLHKISLSLKVSPKNRFFWILNCTCVHNLWFKSEMLFLFISSSTYLVNFKRLYNPLFRKIEHNIRISIISALNISIRNNIFILYNILCNHLDIKIFLMIHHSKATLKSLEK